MSGGAALSPGRNLVLIGLMGAGKTTVGGRVATLLQRPFVDTDAMVEAQAGRTVAAIFAADGERAFRAMEAEAIRRVSALRGQVVAVGGGALEDPANATMLRSTGDLVWLEAEPGALAQRVGGGGVDPVRPLLNGSAPPVERLTSLLEQRSAGYAAAAAVRIATDGLGPAAVADAVLTWARGRAGLLSGFEGP